jgi:superfamily II DNA/RNA helicase
MLDTEFLTQVQEIVANCTHDGLQKAIFSATLPASAEKLAMSMLQNPVRIVVGLKYSFYHIVPGTVLKSSSEILLFHLSLSL